MSMQNMSLIHINLVHKLLIFFTYNSIAISWRFTNQMLVATSNCFKIVATLVIGHIQSFYGLNLSVNIPTVIFDDNDAFTA